VWTNTHRRYFNEPAPENEHEPQSAACGPTTGDRSGDERNRHPLCLLAKSRFLSIGAFFRD